MRVTGGLRKGDQRESIFFVALPDALTISWESRTRRNTHGRVAFEIAFMGRTGLDTNDPAQKYQLKNLPGNFSGLNLVCLMYVAFKSIAPETDIGFDLSKEYAAAKNLHREKNTQ